MPGKITKFKRDSILGLLGTIDAAHKEIHEGETFEAWYRVPNGSTIANNGTLDMIISTGAKELHIVEAIAFGGDCELDVYVDGTYSGGTSFTPINLKHSSSEVSTASVSTQATAITVSAVGTLKDEDLFFGGTGGNARGGAIRADTEIIWKINSDYLIRLTNRSGQAQRFMIKLQWYEEEP
jgi:hypothetical protein